MPRHQRYLGRKDGKKELGLMLHLLLMKMKRYSGASTRQKVQYRKALQIESALTVVMRKESHWALRYKEHKKPTYSDKSKRHVLSLLSSCHLQWVLWKKNTTQYKYIFFPR